jgi:hypothetical protein
LWCVSIVTTKSKSHSFTTATTWRTIHILIKQSDAGGIVSRSLPFYRLFVLTALKQSGQNCVLFKKKKTQVSILIFGIFPSFFDFEFTFPPASLRKKKNLKKDEIYHILI